MNRFKSSMVSPISLGRSRERCKELDVQRPKVSGIVGLFHLFGWLHVLVVHFRQPLPQALSGLSLAARISSCTAFFQCRYDSGVGWSASLMVSASFAFGHESVDLSAMSFVNDSCIASPLSQAEMIDGEPMMDPSRMSRRSPTIGNVGFGGPVTVALALSLLFAASCGPIPASRTRLFMYSSNDSTACACAS